MLSFIWECPCTPLVGGSFSSLLEVLKGEPGATLGALWWFMTLSGTLQLPLKLMLLSQLCPIRKIDVLRPTCECESLLWVRLSLRAGWEFYSWAWVCARESNWHDKTQHPFSAGSASYLARSLLQWLFTLSPCVHKRLALTCPKSHLLLLRGCKPGLNKAPCHLHK